MLRLPIGKELENCQGRAAEVIDAGQIDNDVLIGDGYMPKCRPFELTRSRVIQPALDEEDRVSPLDQGFYVQPPQTAA